MKSQSQGSRVDLFLKPLEPMCCEVTLQIAEQGLTLLAVEFVCALHLTTLGIRILTTLMGETVSHCFKLHFVVGLLFSCVW